MNNHLSTKELYWLIDDLKKKLAEITREKNYLTYFRQFDYSLYYQYEESIKFLEEQIAKYESMLYDPKIK
jgi:hypothetical protein